MLEISRKEGEEGGGGGGRGERGGEREREGGRGRGEEGKEMKKKKKKKKKGEKGRLTPFHDNSQQKHHFVAWRALFYPYLKGGGGDKRWGASIPFFHITLSARGKGGRGNGGRMMSYYDNLKKNTNAKQKQKQKKITFGVEEIHSSPRIT